MKIFFFLFLSTVPASGGKSEREEIRRKEESLFHDKITGGLFLVEDETSATFS